MIPDIGLMVGFYIITRMLIFLKGEDSGLARFFGVVTIFVTVFCMLDLFRSGVPAGLK